jgi:hypothetical protein
MFYFITEFLFIGSLGNLLFSFRTLANRIWHDLFFLNELVSSNDLYIYFYLIIWIRVTLSPQENVVFCFRVTVSSLNLFLKWFYFQILLALFFINNNYLLYWLLGMDSTLLRLLVPILPWGISFSLFRPLNDLRFLHKDSASFFILGRWRHLIDKRRFL